MRKRTGVARDRVHEHGAPMKRQSLVGLRGADPRDVFCCQEQRSAPVIHPGVGGTTMVAHAHQHRCRAATNKRKQHSAARTRSPLVP